MKFESNHPCDNNCEATCSHSSDAVDARQADVLKHIESLGAFEEWLENELVLIEEMFAEFVTPASQLKSLSR